MVVPTASSLEARFPTRAGTTSRQNFFETVTEKKLISWFGELEVICTASVAFVLQPGY